MIILGNKKKDYSAIVGTFEMPSSSEGEGSQEREELEKKAEMSDKMIAANQLMKAFKNNDVEGLIYALESFMTACYESES